jgi:hypothetical protein
MILRLLEGRGMVSELFEKKRDANPPHPAPPQALFFFFAESSRRYQENFRHRGALAPGFVQPCREFSIASDNSKNFVRM